MKLDIKSPSYYEQHYTLDIEIIEMNNAIMGYIDHNQYSEVIKIVDIVPVVAPLELLEKGLWEEEIMFSRSVGRISVFKHVNYEKYMNGTVEERKKLTIKCVLEAIWMIKKKPGTKFNAKQLEKDLLEFVGYTKEEIETLQVYILFFQRIKDRR